MLGVARHERKAEQEEERSYSPHILNYVGDH